MKKTHPAQRLIIHADMDCFFAAVEERENPRLKGKPVVIGSDPKGGAGRGIVATANYEARTYGIGSALPISIAYRRCPHAVFIKPNGKLYREVSREIMKILAAHADVLEKVSIDEAYLDCSRLETFEDGRDLARTIQKEIYDTLSLSVSLGVGPNKLIAKIASDHKKPGGVTVVIPERVQEFLDPQGVRVLRGVGPKTAEHLHEMGYKTVRQLREAPEDSLVRSFGKFGRFLFREARGLDNRPVDMHGEAKSKGREYTFEHDSDDRAEIKKRLLACVERVHKDMTDDGLWCHTVTVKIRYQGFETHSRQTTLSQATGELERLRLAAPDLLTPFLEDPRPVRLVGFSVSRLVAPEDLLPLRPSL